MYHMRKLFSLVDSCHTSMVLQCVIFNFMYIARTARALSIVIVNTDCYGGKEGHALQYEYQKICKKGARKENRRR